MSVNEWIALAGIAISAAAAIGPAVAAIHAKLAVVASQVTTLCEKVERLSSAHEERLRMCFEHQSRLDTHETQIADLNERLHELS